MRIGIDFDNTIADYRNVFAPVARDIGLVDDAFTGDKADVRAFLRDRPGGESYWQRLQGQVYGRYIGLAAIMPGLGGFLDVCKNHDADIFIVSHKTEYGHHDDARINLRDAATGWLADNRFFAADGYAIDPGNLVFKATREEKIDAIRALALDHFIDDLAEIFTDDGFPATTRGHLLQSTRADDTDTSNWQAIRESIFGH